MTRQEEADFIYSYRQKLIDCGRKVMFENPDRLCPAEVDALTQKVLTEINALDIAVGMSSHDMNFRYHGVPESRGRRPLQWVYDKPQFEKSLFF